MKYVCIWLIRLYRKYLSPLKRQPCCRFEPTCSAYAIEAFQKRGFFVGLILTVGRIFRCQPCCEGGYDPVPEKGLRNPKVKFGDGNEDKNNDKTGGDRRGFRFDYELSMDGDSDIESENEKKN